MAMEERSTRIYRQQQMLSKEALTEIENLCIHEQPAYCVAACPFKLDAKQMVRAVAGGDFAKALALYEKITPFVHILSAGCEAPCEQKCKLCEAGEGIAIHELERAVARFGKSPKNKGLLRFKKRKSVAIFGSSLFSLFLAGELAKKAYPLTIYCDEPDAAAFVAAGASFLDSDGLNAEVETLQSMDITFRFGTKLTAQLFEQKKTAYDIVGASPRLLSGFWPGFEVDEATMLCKEVQVISTPVGAQGVLASLFGAKKAALTVDRLAQNLDPRSSRGDEGASETALITNMDSVAGSCRIHCEKEGYTKEDAITEAKRCIQCSCTECVKGCVYLQHYKKYPKVLTREIYNNVSIIMGDHMMNKPINSCALCGQCAVVCPNGYDMADICLMARRNMVTTDKMPLAPHEFALLDQMFSNEEAFLCKPQPGFAKSKYVFFPGCQAAAIAPDTVRAVYLDLSSRLEGGVALLLGCCGAISEWAGRYQMYDEAVAFIDARLKELGNPAVIAGCPTCKKMLSQHYDGEIVGIWDVLEEIGLPKGAQKISRPVAMHDSCGARGDAHTQQTIRKLAGKLGCELVETEFSGDTSPCCGYGGLVMYANREVAHEMAQMCVNRTDAPYITYCMACRDRFAREGRESRHILELIYGTNAGEPPDISEKRYNRLMLKNGLLHEIWGEEILEMTCEFPITFMPEALKLMDDRMILKEDVIKVMESFRETEEAIFDSESGLMITRKRIGNVTFWVKYEEQDGGYLIHSAYSHRMKIDSSQ
ncbi:pyridine nucleotide-disulfide oxidoreductase/dicluster-binding protein [Oscillospiraceae bacterium LTW-04]|nr:4Fe-4S dicluster domain-containing protein [Oscillospiraceae bacterium MB24-C1]